MGLIDAMKCTWGNDRPEFDDFPQSKIDTINAHYKYVGFYRFDWGLEEAYYIYYDKNQQFGIVRYHQDEFDVLWDEHLTVMLTNSPANQTFEELMIQVLKHLAEGIFENYDE